MASAELTRQRPAATRARLASDARRPWFVAYTSLWAFTFGTAVLVCVVPGGAALALGIFHLALTAAQNPPPSIAGVLSIAANNTLHSVWPLSLGLIDAQRRRFTRTLADALVTTNIAVPGVLVGAALAAYGARVLPYLPHVPFEFAGIAAGASGWFVERDRPLTTHERILCAGVTVVLLLLAATVETCLVPHR